jgi:hypothetical protein
MSDPISPFEASPPTARRLTKSIVVALVAALVILVLVVLPAEYDIDPTGLGRMMGLTDLSKPSRTLQVKDVIGGNEKIREIAVPDPGKPTPLPNPAVSQIKTVEAQTRTMTIHIDPDLGTEIKAIMDPAQVIIYSWTSDHDVYTDFHGHDPSAGEGFVRYEEQQSGHEGHGSLVAPFSGEHGWYWLNLSDKPTTITLKITGYFRDIKDYGVIR